MSTVIGQEDKNESVAALTQDLLKIKNHGFFGTHVVDRNPKERIPNEPVNVGTPGHIDHGSQNLDTSSILQSLPPEDIEYEMNDWKRAKPMLWNTDAKNGGKKRDKAKAKAQKKARKVSGK